MGGYSGDLHPIKICQDCDCEMVTSATECPNDECPSRLFDLELEVEVVSRRDLNGVNAMVAGVNLQRRTRDLQSLLQRGRH